VQDRGVSLCDECGPDWIRRGLERLYAIHPRLVAESRAIHAEWWPHLCRTGPYSWKKLRRRERAHTYAQCMQYDATAWEHQ